jgi:hypothetical protein
VRGAVLGDLSEQPVDDGSLGIVGVNQHREPGGILTHMILFPRSGAAGAHGALRERQPDLILPHSRLLVIEPAGKLPRRPVGPGMIAR